MDLTASPQIKVSVIVAVYNTQQFLRECLDSLIAQTLQNIEIIVVNDCSTDNSVAIIEEYVAKYSPIQLIHNPNNIKLGPTRNHGVSIARGEYLCFVDSDDYLLPQGLELMYNATHNATADIVLGNYAILESHDKPLKQPVPDMVREFKFSKFAIPLYAWGRLFRREFWLVHKFKFAAVYAEDLMLIPIVTACATHINVINDNVCVYRTNPNSLTHRYHAYSELISVLQNLYNHFKCNGEYTLEHEALLLSNFYNLTKVIKTSIDRYRYFLAFKKMVPTLIESEFLQPPLINKSKLKKLKLIYKTNGIYLLLKPDTRQFRKLFA